MISRLRTALFLIFAVVLLTPSAAWSHQDYSLAPNARSPWRSATTLTTYYGEICTHRDWCGSTHYNYYHALDLARTCGAPLYGMYDGMRVTQLDRPSGTLEMVGSPGGRRIQVRYLHMNPISADLTVGSIVNASTYVGREGALGQASGCHLHLSVRVWSGHDSSWYSIRPQICGREIPNTKRPGAVRAC